MDNSGVSKSYPETLQGWPRRKTRVTDLARIVLIPLMALRHPRPGPDMVNIIKFKFKGMLRGWLRRLDNASDTAPEVQSRASAASSQPAANPFSPAPWVASADRQQIEIPLTAIVDALPKELRAKIVSAPKSEMTLRVPVATVLNQLPFGAVKITYGELRRMAPAVFAGADNGMDSRPVSLPLKEILARLDPALLARRSAETVRVASDIAGPFGGRGQDVHFSAPPPKATASSLAAGLESLLNRPRQAESAAPSIDPLPSLSRQTSPPAPGHHPVTSQRLKVDDAPLSLKPLAVPVLPAAAPAAARAEAAQPTIFAALSELSESWPDELKNEIRILAPAQARVLLPGSLLEPGLRRGRVTMTWKQLRTLARLNVLASPNDHLELELPLKVIAPLYCAAQKGGLPPQRRPAVSAEIPDLFTAFPAPPPAPKAEEAPRREPAAATSEDSNFYSRNELTATALPEVVMGGRPTPSQAGLPRRQTPQEIVDRAMALPGVAGAVVALLDGLRVVGQVPEDCNADALAAFLPQIYERVNQSTRELRMGALNNVGFTVGNVPWKIFRVRSVYFAAFGRAGETLPGAALARLVAELDGKKAD